MCNTHQASATIQRRTEVIPIAQLSLARMQPHTHRQYLNQTCLCLDRRVHCSANNARIA
jgi:hypothetical protein